MKYMIGKTLMFFFLGVPLSLHAAIYYVATTGNDSANGSSATPWRTLQKAGNTVAAGDTVIVRAGTYVGFSTTRSGTANNRITYQAEPGVLINGKPTNQSAFNGYLNLEGASYVTIEGFTVNAGAPNAPGSNYGSGRAGIRSVENTNVIIRNNRIDYSSWWGILTGNSVNLLIENNYITNTQIQHGIYVANSADNPTLKYNRIEGSRGAGIQINADKDLPGDGIISNARVEGNVLLNNCSGESSSLNLNGVESSVIVNNLIASQFRNGIAMYQDNQTAGTKNNLVANNTIIGSAYYGISISGASSGNRLFNNILISQGWNSNYRGGLGVEPAAQAGLESDYNILIGRVNGDPSNTESPAYTFTQWKNMGFDAHSIHLEDSYGSQAAALQALFVTAPSVPLYVPQSGDYHLLTTGMAKDRGTGVAEAMIDLDGNARPQGAAFDIGAFEYLSGASGNQAPTVASAAAANPNPVAGTNTALSALGDDDGGEPALTYTWATTGTPPASVSFSPNGTNAAKNTTATFTRAGTYNLRVTIRDAGSLTVTSNVTVTVNQTLTTIVVTPNPTSAQVSTTKQFTATARDQFAQTMSAQPAFTWSAQAAAGTVNSSGLLSASAVPGGPHTVIAQSGAISGTAQVTITAGPPPNDLPLAGITDPSAGDIYTLPASVLIAGTASDPDGTIAKVEFFSGSTLLATDTSVPYAFNWVNPPAGQRQVRMVATDDDGGTVEVTVTITVNEPTNNGGGEGPAPATAAKDTMVAQPGRPAFFDCDGVGEVKIWTRKGNEAATLNISGDLYWNGGDLPSGFYMLQKTCDGVTTKNRKFVIIR